MKFARYIIAVFVLLLSFALGAFGEEAKLESKPEAKQEAEHRHTMGQEKRFVATVGTDGVQHVELIGGEYYFDPNYIVVKVNTPVELKVKKEPGYVPHNITVNAPDAGIDFKSDMEKEWKTITFTPTKIGKYEMVCDKKLLFFKSHRDRGMDGYIEVVP